ncbi:MAG TPA: NUDIX domain-containing protein [Kofleriaceae bacterium]|nr:NUDIX domain-containing protein [Kofleriaceae bacterium]
MNVLDHPRLADTYRQLAGVGLNPRRHTAANAHAHSEAVSARAGALARANGCSADDVELLENLGRVHDIGKITGTAKPEKSLDVLREHDVTDARLLALVKWHDTNLPWYNAAQRGQPPSDKAWRRLAAELDVRLLALFMVADRVDAPPGWRRNAPLVWFLGEARTRGLVGVLTLDLPGHASEVSAGCALVHDGRVLAIRVRSAGFELPKGGIEWDELPEEAATRELREEAGVTSAVVLAGKLGHVDYEVGDGADRHTKRVVYYRGTSAAEPVLGELPERTRERRWLTSAELASVPVIDESLRRILASALG